MQILKKLLVVAIIAASLDHAFGMSREQLLKTLTIMKKSCMPKNGVSEDKVGKISEGVFIEEKNVMCYIACVYKSVQVVKDDRLNRDMVMKQVDILYPPELKDPAKAAIKKCFNVQDSYDDLCSRSFYAAKCLYETDSSSFVFP